MSHELKVGTRGFHTAGSDPERPTVAIAIPIVRPLAMPLDKPEYVTEVWNAFVKPEQDAEIPPSVEMRLLMAILRSVYDGLAMDPEGDS
jgi:hypothetical protein